MFDVLSLGLKEFWRAFGKRAPGGRDFLWLTSLLCLLQLLALIMVSAREGVLERSVDAFLGYAPGFGIPVWTRTNSAGYGGVQLISEDLLAEIEEAGVGTEAFYRFFGPEIVQMPGNGVWRTVDGIEERDSFTGIAADFDGAFFPEIRSAPAQSAFGEVADQLWTIILDEDQFRRFFDLAAYRRVLDGRIPQTALDEVPEDIRRLTDMPMIWLQTRTQLGGYRLVPFRVQWGRYLGAGSENYAYILERRWFRAVDMQFDNPDLCVDLMAGPGLPPPVNRAQSANLLFMDGETSADVTERFKSTFDIVAAQYGGAVTISTNRAYWEPQSEERLANNCSASIPSTVLDLFLFDAGFDIVREQDRAEGAEIEVLSVPAVPDFEIRPDGMSAPCDLLNDRLLSDPTTRQETWETGCVAHISATAGGSGYSEVLLFAEERTDIDRLRDLIACEGLTPATLENGPAHARAICSVVETPWGEEVVQSRLRLSESYADSLLRLGFLTRLFDTISGPIGFALLVLLVAILRVQIGTVVEHRRQDYALLLANGFSHGQLKGMVAWQLAFGVLTAMATALLLFTALKSVLLARSSQLSEDFERVLLGRIVDALPLSIGSVVSIVGVVLVLGALFAWWQMQRNGVSRTQSLEALMR